jgi:hypothetical protein
VHGKPTEGVIYSSVYSDGSNELSNPAYKTGYGNGQTDAAGAYHTTWVIPTDAPLGPAKVNVITGSAVPTRQMVSLPYAVVDKKAPCP